MPPGSGTLLTHAALVRTPSGEASALLASAGRIAGMIAAPMAESPPRVHFHWYAGSSSSFPQRGDDEGLFGRLGDPMLMVSLSMGGSATFRPSTVLGLFLAPIRPWSSWSGTERGQALTAGDRVLSANVRARFCAFTDPGVRMASFYCGLLAIAHGTSHLDSSACWLPLGALRVVTLRGYPLGVPQLPLESN